jgi:plasmid stabilization system protein ParE
VTRRLEFHPEARAELLAAIDRYELLQPGLGASFITAVQNAAQHSLDWPEAGTPVGDTLRRVFVRRFPYYLLYAPEGDRLVIIAVGHFRRHPAFWSDRG